MEQVRAGAGQPPDVTQPGSDLIGGELEPATLPLLPTLSPTPPGLTWPYSVSNGKSLQRGSWSPTCDTQL